MYMNGDIPEKPIDLVLGYIEKMKHKNKGLDLEIDAYNKRLINLLNEKIVLEEKIIKWIQVADKFKFKKKK